MLKTPIKNKSIQGALIIIDHQYFENVQLIDCFLIYHGDPYIFINVELQNCKVILTGKALMTANFINTLKDTEKDKIPLYFIANKIGNFKNKQPKYKLEEQEIHKLTSLSEEELVPIITHLLVTNNPERTILFEDFLVDNNQLIAYLKQSGIVREVQIETREKEKENENENENENEKPEKSYPSKKLTTKQLSEIEPINNKIN